MGAQADYGEPSWQFFREGVDILPLYGGRSDGAAAASLRYRGGSRLPAHRHSDWEHILVLQGSQTDESAEYPAGTLVLNHPGSTHRVVSAAGCVVLAIWTGPVAMLEANGQDP